VLNGRGPVLVRRGSGYGLELGEATLDADAFEELASMAGEAADAGDHRRTSELVREALSYWRGPVLGDVALGPAGRARAERLEQLRLHALEQRFDSELALGRDKELVGELQALVGQNPYRERFVGQLMLALYRAGRQAEALDVYEETRRRLDSDLGLQPSAELRVLSGQIVRQEPQLRRPPAAQPTFIAGRGSPRRARRLAGLVTASGGAATPSSVGVSERIVLVHPLDADPDQAMQWGESWRTWARAWGYEPELVAFDEASPGGAAASSLRERVAEGRFALVVVAGDGAVARAVRPLVRELPATAFVFADASLGDLSLRDAPNASAIRFRDEQSSELAGYASALAPLRLGRAGSRIESVSIVAGGPTPHVRRVVQGFVRGLRHVPRTIRVSVDYVHDTQDVTACERIANRRIDAGAELVYAIAGRCGRGALAVARARGVWGEGEVATDTDPGPAMLTATDKAWSRALGRVVTNFSTGFLPFGRDDVLGLEDDYAVLIWLGTPRVPEWVWSKVAHRCSELREAAAEGA
jgi:basic membrane lipoprotein Med (substrate-binding protein (PBP1-ABC) superfamily)